MSQDNFQRQDQDSSASSGRPVFIHCMWRTGSTYIWKLFRDQPRYRAYHEPLHESLLWLQDPHGADNSRYAEGAARMRHPELDHPYMTEFPFKPEGGVEYFEKQLSYERYAIDEYAADERLFRYIANLIAYAKSNGQIPVFKFTRSLLRSRWLARNFPSRNILLLRRPIDVWRSFRLQGRYFSTVMCGIVGQNQQDPVLRAIARTYGVPFFRHDNFGDEWNFYQAFAAKNLSGLYPLFYEFYIYTCVYNLASADCVIDINRISEDPEIAEMASQRLAELGIVISLSGARVPCYDDLTSSELEWISQEPRLRQTLAQRLPAGLLLSSHLVRSHEDCLSPCFRTVCAEFVGPAVLPEAPATQ
jgi:hypothetical protein